MSTKKKTNSTWTDYINAGGVLVNCLSVIFTALGKFYIYGFKVLKEKRKNKLYTIPFLIALIIGIVYFYINFISVNNSNAEYKFIGYTLSFIFSIIPLSVVFIVLNIIYKYNKWNVDREQDEKKEKEERIFSIIGFKNKNGEYPKIIYTHQANNRNIYYILSDNTLTEWKNKQEHIEKAFNSNVVSIDYDSKKNIKITTTDTLENEKDSNFCMLFERINFKSKLGEYPRFIKSREEENQNIFYFESDISLVDWQKSKDNLETIFNTNVVEIKQGKNKQIVELWTTDLDISNFIEWNTDYLKEEDMIMSLGRTALKEVTINMDSLTNGIISGSVGSGKSVTLSGLLIQFLQKRQYFNIPFDFYIFDGKGGVDFGDFEDYSEFTTDLKKFSKMLDKIWKTYEERKKLFKGNYKKIADYNKSEEIKLSRVIVVIDEISLITDTRGLQKEEREIREPIIRKISDLARLARAFGIHLLIGIQVPNMQTMPGQIKNVMDLRISGFLSDESASRIILNNSMASKLPEIKGRMVLGKTEYQAYYFDTEKILRTIPNKKMVDLSKKKEQKENISTNIKDDEDVVTANI
ncbi:MAG: hypothetical protein JW924_01085 [Fusobacteriaceae bacterium]|nr:hypothetical protein [Fusobacteriaceae bacterium]